MYKAFKDCACAFISKDFWMPRKVYCLCVWSYSKSTGFLYWLSTRSTFHLLPGFTKCLIPRRGAASLFCLTSAACGCRCSLSAAVSWASRGVVTDICRPQHPGTKMCVNFPHPTVNVHLALWLPGSKTSRSNTSSTCMGTEYLLLDGSHEEW